MWSTTFFDEHEVTPGVATRLVDDFVSGAALWDSLDPDVDPVETKERVIGAQVERSNDAANSKNCRADENWGIDRMSFSFDDENVRDRGAAITAGFVTRIQAHVSGSNAWTTYQ